MVTLVLIFNRIFNKFEGLRVFGGGLVFGFEEVGIDDFGDINCNIYAVKKGAR